MIVCIAEKPSVARDIANVLGARERKDGYLEGNGYQVTWTLGHLCMLKEPHEYLSQWKSWSLANLPMIPPRFGIKLIADKGIERQFHVVEQLFLKADEIVNCGDAGQEGELIQRWVLQKTGARCPVKRLWISSLTEESIREGFKTLKDQSDYQPLYEAGLSRAIGDWLLGMNATRLYTLKYRSTRGSVLSIGRVQTPTLALIVNRQKEIDNFKPEQYWELKTTYRDTLFTALKSRFTKKEDGEAVLETIRQSPFTITDVSTKEGVELPPRLFDLTSLQVECNRRYSYSADDTLKIIQSLYEKKFTTYPRVDTTYLSDDIYPKCPSILAGLRDYSSLITPLQGQKLVKRKKVFDTSKVTDHHAIIPTGQYAQGMTEREQHVYDLVARHFIAVFYPDCKFSTTTAMGEAAKIEFKVTGKQILSPGWRAVIGSSAEKDDDEHTLPAFVRGESGPHEPSLTEKWTQPPKYYTEATLLRAMETAGKLVDDDELRDLLKENGIGRPSTRAAIIETLYKRNYMRKERKNLVATPTGIELIDLIHEDLLKSAELTGIWEKKLRGIEKKTYDARTFLEELKQMVRDIVAHVMSDSSNRHVAQAPTSAKEIKQLAAQKKARRKSTTTRPAAPKVPSATPASSSGEGKKSPAALPADDSILGRACPLCGKGIIIKGKTAYGCSQWRSGCNWRLPFPKKEDSSLF
jgi:DNA topoisomerase-3